MREHDLLAITQIGDDLDAWKQLVYWIMAGSFGLIDVEGPVFADHVMVVVRCWLLGDENGIPNFQDVAMMHLLHYYEGNAPELKIPPEDVSKVYASSHKAREKRMKPLRNLIAEEIVKQQAHPDQTGRDGKIYNMAGYLTLPGVAAAVEKARKRYHKNPKSTPPREFVGRLYTPEGAETSMWKEFLVGNKEETTRLPFVPDARWWRDAKPRWGTER